MAHTHTLVFFFERGVSFFLVLLAGIALQDDLLGTLSLSPIFLLAQILMRTDLGDEPDSPRQLRSSPTGGGHHKDAANLRSQGPYPSPQPKSPKRRQRRSQMDLSLTFPPPRVSGAGGDRPVNLLILLKPPQTAQLCGYRAHLAAISDLPRHTSQSETSMASLKRTNPATPAQTQVDRRRRQVAARPAGAATDEKTQTADAPSRATSGDRAPTAAAGVRTIPAICRPRFSTTPTRRKRKQWKPICGPG